MGTWSRFRTIYDKFKKFGANGIEYDDDYNDNIDNDTKTFLQKIYNSFGQYTAWKLRDMTHQETPWLETERNSVINRKSMENYFREHYNSIYA